MTNADFRVDRPAFEHYRELGRLRDEADIQWNTTCGGFWLLQRYEHVREVMQSPEVFTNETISPFHRTQELRLVPQILGGEEHLRYRQLLNPWFSPGAVRRREDDACGRCAALVDGLLSRGGCDLVADFALRYPTDVFCSCSSSAYPPRTARSSCRGSRRSLRPLVPTPFTRPRMRST